jgi:hypothetical protein
MKSQRTIAPLVFMLVLITFILLTGCATTKDYTHRRKMAYNHEIMKNRYVYKTQNYSNINGCSTFKDINNNWMFKHNRQWQLTK